MAQTQLAQQGLPARPQPTLYKQPAFYKYRSTICTTNSSSSYQIQQQMFSVR